MNFNEPIRRFRSIRVPDGQDGWIERMPRTWQKFFGAFAVHKNTTVVFADRFEDVIVGDYLGVADDSGPEALYRVTSRVHVAGTPRVELGIERVERPISPVSIALVSASGSKLVSPCRLTLVVG